MRSEVEGNRLPSSKRLHPPEAPWSVGGWMCWPLGTRAINSACLESSAHVCKSYNPSGKPWSRGLNSHSDARRPGNEHWRAEERKEASFPTVTDHLGCGEHNTQSPESTFHLYFKQIGGLAGHYHLECPVMGNWGGKGAAHFWLIFTKVFVCFFSNVNDATDRVEQKGHCGLNYGIVPIKFCLLSAWLMMNTIL